MRIKGKTVSLGRPGSTTVSRRSRPTAIRHRCATRTNRGRSSPAQVGHLFLKTVQIARTVHAWNLTIAGAICVGSTPWLSSPLSLQLPISPTSVTMFGGRGIRSKPSFLNPCSALTGGEPLRVTICQRAHRRLRAAPRRSLDGLPSDKGWRPRCLSPR